jgi:two-component system sensor histidine kinase BaeS
MPPGRRLAQRLAIAFAAVAALTALLVAGLVWAGWTWQFDRYFTANLERLAEGWADVFAEGYEVTGGWGDWIARVPRFAMMRGSAMQLHDENGEVLLEDAGMRRKIAVPQARYLEPVGPVVESPVTVGGEQVGTVVVWSPTGSQLVGDLEERFRRGSFVGLMLAGTLALAAASLAGWWYANRVVQPVERITVTAQALRSGDAKARTGLSGDDEVAVLGRTFDQMADAIEADRELERRLTADVAHELRTPLQAIQATVEAMQDGVLEADVEHLGVVRDETVRLARLADGILELTRLERGLVPFQHERVDVGAVAATAADAHRALFEAAGITLSQDLANHVYAAGDPDRLIQATGNLLNNAARYTPTGGRVDVAVRSEGDQAVVEIADTGIGLAEEDLPHVFSRFWRADDARARTTGGLGIGLAVVKEIVERHGGTVGASRRPSGGSVFTIRLPLTTGGARV